MRNWQHSSQLPVSCASAHEGRMHTNIGSPSVRYQTDRVLTITMTMPRGGRETIYRAFGTIVIPPEDSTTACLI